MIDKPDDTSYLVILGAGPQQEKLYILASKFGHKIIGVDINKNALAKKYCDIFLNISIKDDVEIIKRLQETKLNFSGVVTCGAEVSPQVSRIAESFNLIGIPHKVAINTTDKFARSKALQAKGIKIPLFQLIEIDSDIDIALPVIIKPIDSSGSRGVSLVYERNKLSEAIALAQKVSQSNKVLCEEFIKDGTEVSIEAFVIDGVPHITGIAERHFLDIEKTFPEFIEYGGTMPPTFSSSLQLKCEKVFSDAIIALEIKGGPSKGDLIIRDNEVFVLEVTSRTSPGFAAEMQPLNSGIEPLKILLKWATGESIDLELLKPKFSRGVAHRYFQHEPGVVDNIKGLESISNNPDIKYHLILNSPVKGEVLQPMSYMNRLFYIITDGETNLEAISKAETALNNINITTR